eukprot:scaffold72384_cov42-Cyclotella_meneghiniana.AAC.2
MSTINIEESKYCFHKDGNKFHVTPKVNLDLHDKLPPGTYTVNYDSCRSEYFLEIIDDFALNGKIYGDVAKTSDRILRTFMERQRSTGVLLVGEKGSGKTLLAQYMSIAAAKENGIPTIVVNQPWHGDEFNLFIQSISQPTIIFFDEFEKVYRNDHENQQEKMLTLFDGVYSSQKLFLLTCNDKSRLNDHLMNRPGRIYYMLEYGGLQPDFITEYCEDNLVQKEHISSVCAISALFSSFNFDMLKAMVEDMNRYGESPSEVLKYLNVRPDVSRPENYSVKLIVGGNNTLKEGMQNSWSGNPLKEVVNIYHHDMETGKCKNYYFSPSHMQNLNTKTRVLQFKNGSGDILILTPVSMDRFSVNYDTLSRMKQDNDYADSDDEEKKYETMANFRY